MNTDAYICIRLTPLRALGLVMLHNLQNGEVNPKKSYKSYIHIYIHICISGQPVARTDIPNAFYSYLAG